MAIFEVQGPDGKVYEVDAPTAEAAADGFKRYLGQSSPQSPPSRGFGAAIYDNVVGNPNDGVDSYGEQLGTWLNRAGESMTLGIVGDEASAAVTGQLPGRSYDSELSRYRQNERDMSTLGRVSADIVGALVPGFGMAGAMAKAPSLTRAAMTGAALGGAGGAVQGFMEGEGGAADRSQSSLVGLGLGASLGAATPVLGALFQSALRGGKDVLARGRIGSQGAKALGVKPQAARALSDAIGTQDDAAMRAAMAKAGPDAMLAEASPGLTGMLDYTIRSPGQAAQVALPRVNDRASSVLGGLTDQLDRSMGAPQGLNTAMSGVKSASAPARKAAYDLAYSRPIDYASEAGMSLEQLGPRIPAEAVRYANRLMQVRGEKSPQIMARLADDGTAVFETMPDVRQWDYIKQGLQQMAESGDGAGAMGGQTRLGSSYQSLGREIRDSLASAVPEYRTALDTAADTISQTHGIKFGSGLLDKATTREMVREALDGATKPEIAAIRQGARQQIDEVLANVRAVASDPNIDGRQVQAALANMTSPAAKEKLAAILGDEWPALAEKLDAAASIGGLRAGIAANSATYGRGVWDNFINEAVDPGPLRRGEPVKALKQGAATAMGASDEAVKRLRADARAQLADVLTRPGAASILDTMQQIGQRNAVDPQSGSALRRLFEAYMLGGAGRNSERINSAISQRMPR